MPPFRAQPKTNLHSGGFTLVELLVTITVIAILASLLLPTLSSAHENARKIGCVNNTRQLWLAWNMYTDDHNGYLPYNVGSGTGRGISTNDTNLNWVGGVMTWGLDADNTNSNLLLNGSIGSYLGRAASLYRCPSDHALSSVQRSAGWTARARSYSMNAMIGNAGSASTTGANANNPRYKQFFKAASIPKAADIFVFLDEHPDSIDDGYFVNRSGSLEWTDLPATYHNRSTAFAYADGHADTHRWTVPSTYPAPQPDAANLPVDLDTNSSADFIWITHHMSVYSY